MTVNDLNIEVEYKPIKHIHLSVYPPDGHVHVSAPKDTTEDRLRMFILSKWVWIEEKREILTSYDIQPKREYVSGECHYFKGKKYRLKVNRQTVGGHSVCIKGDYLVVNVHQNTTKDNIKQLLYSWYRKQLTPMIQKLIDKWRPILNVSLNDWEIRIMPARWGGCYEAKKKAYFNVELAKKPIDCVEYVVVHELIHLLEHNHTDRFRRLLDIYLPAWPELKKKLNELPI